MRRFEMNDSFVDCKLWLVNSRRPLFVAVAFAAAIALAPRAGHAARGTLDIYFIDVEGGQSTLIVTPAGESLLVDAGWAGNGSRDARRVVAAARDARVKRIDVLLVTHFHGDHAGGVPELAARLPIMTFVDHDRPLRQDSSSGPVFEAYVPARQKERHIVAKPGDLLPLGSNLEIRVVSSAAATITKPLPGAAGAGRTNNACASGTPPAGEALENPRSTGIVVRFGRFRFVDLGDLTGSPLAALFCPANLLGEADVYLVPHHGGADAVFPATFSLRPRVAIVNNGENKGGDATALASLRGAPAGPDVWQLHRSATAGRSNVPDNRIANLDESTSYWIKVSASADGSFTVTNARTAEVRRY